MSSIKLIQFKSILKLLTNTISIKVFQSIYQDKAAGQDESSGHLHTLNDLNCISCSIFCWLLLGFIRISSWSLAEWLQWERGHPSRKCKHVCVCDHNENVVYACALLWSQCMCECINHSSVGDDEELFVFLIKGKGSKGPPAGPSITLRQRDFRTLGSWSSGD